MAYSTESGEKGPEEALIEGPRGCKFKVPARRSLAIAAGLALALLFHFEIANALGARAQSEQATDARPSFEVVSIRPGRPGDQGVWASDAGRFAVSSVTARYLIEYAYNDFKAGAILRDDQLLGGPGWITTEKWAINAKVDDSTAEKLRKLSREKRGKEIGFMVRAMLADRFKLRVHHEKRMRDVYALVASKGGPKFLSTRFNNTDVKASQLKGPGKKPLPPVTPGLRRFWLHGPISRLAEILSRIPDINRLVLDQTGIQGNYDFVFQWKPEPEAASMLSRPGEAGPKIGAERAANVAGPSIFTALQEQLGLRLKLEKVPVDVVVIDHIEPPSAN